jgi:AcrR family transcriptional regulator
MRRKPPAQRSFLRRTPVQERSRALVDAVVATFDQMLRSSDDDVTIESLLQRAGVGIGSFYEYFSNKDSLVGSLFERVTRENFDGLLAGIDAAQPGTPLDLARELALHVSRAYLLHRTRTRVLIGGIGRLGLMKHVVAERDRFAGQLADRLLRFWPDVPLAHLRSLATEGCDAAMGVVVGELYRPPRPLAEITDQLTELALTLVIRRAEAAARLPR